MRYFKIILGVVILVAVMAGIWWFRGVTKDDYFSFGSDDRIDVTPTQIMSIKAIGEWEFLSVNAEELVDTVRKGFFSDDELVRIYYGTLRLGVNMHQVEPGWITTSGDSITMNLPKIGLLDKDFIDEARTKSFYESGSWKPADRDALYKKAYRLMLTHGMTDENLQAAELNASLQLRQMMLSMGYKNVKITFKK